mmetsp:Transcript_41574/g.71179  ORF Transcript_41574/g.71179 Transcript_41574/m.71179 type:complete len:83 (-) Transcript_41574:113-361(-)
MPTCPIIFQHLCGWRSKMKLSLGMRNAICPSPLAVPVLVKLQLMHVLPGGKYGASVCNVIQMCCCGWREWGIEKETDCRLMK